MTKGEWKEFALVTGRIVVGVGELLRMMVRWIKR
jgi:hypothetical protein